MSASLAQTHYTTHTIRTGPTHLPRHAHFCSDAASEARSREREETAAWVAAPFPTPPRCLDDAADASHPPLLFPHPRGPNTKALLLSATRRWREIVLVGVHAQITHVVPDFQNALWSEACHHRLVPRDVDPREAPAWRCTYWARAWRCAYWARAWRCAYWVRAWIDLVASSGVGGGSITQFGL